MRLVAAGSVLVVALSACAAPGGEPTPRPSPELTPAPTVRDVTSGGRRLEAGPYTRHGFSPRITFEVAEGWEAAQSGAGFFDIQQDAGSPDVIAVQFGNVAAVFGPDGEARPTSAAEAAAVLGANPNLTALESGESRMGGLTGSQVTVENAGDAHASVLDVPAGTLGIDPGRRLWVALFDTDAGILAVMVGGSTERWDEALAAAEPVLESVVIGDPAETP